MTKKANIPAKRLLRLKDAANYLAISPGTLRRIVQSGQLEIVRLIDSSTAPWLLDAKDLDKLIERSKTTISF